MLGLLRKHKLSKISHQIVLSQIEQAIINYMYETFKDVKKYKQVSTDSWTYHFNSNDMYIYGTYGTTNNKHVFLNSLIIDDISEIKNVDKELIIEFIIQWLEIDQYNPRLHQLLFNRSILDAYTIKSRLLEC